MQRRCVVLIPLLGSLAAILYVPALARDLDGRYANSPLKPWFDQLKSGRGLCCAQADGYVVEEADWESKDGHYRVRVPKNPVSTEMLWVDVPANAVITEPNRTGRTMVWPDYPFAQGYSNEQVDGQVLIRCFMPGSMT